MPDFEKVPRLQVTKVELSTWIIFHLLSKHAAIVPTSNAEFRCNLPRPEFSFIKKSAFQTDFTFQKLEFDL